MPIRTLPGMGGIMRMMRIGQSDTIHNWTKKMVAECYGNSFGRLVAAFIGDGKLSEEDANELRKLL